MARSTDYVHFAGITSAHFGTDKGATYSTVDIDVRDESNGFYKVHLFCESESEMIIIMTAMAKAVREYFGDAEPEPDYEAIASEMATDLYMETVRGV